MHFLAKITEISLIMFRASKDFGRQIEVPRLVIRKQDQIQAQGAFIGGGGLVVGNLRLGA